MSWEKRDIGSDARFRAGTQPGAVRAREGDLGIIPGSMGARSYIVRGKGNPESFNSCSHGAGRKMSRGEAKRRFTLADHEAATAGVECRNDPDVIDETPGAYKDIDAVIAAEQDLIEVVHTLRQVVCVKGMTLRPAAHRGDATVTEQSAEPREGWYVITRDKDGRVGCVNRYRGGWLVVETGPYPLPLGWTLGQRIDDLMRDAARYR